MTKRIFNINRQKGVSLIITFLIMTIMLAIILSISTIVSNKVKIISNMGNSVSSFNAVLSGVEKTLYFDKKQVPVGASRGFCNICNVCTDCNSCALTPLSSGGCDAINCTNCQLSYNSTFDNRTYTINAKVAPDPLNCNLPDFSINSKGFYRDITRSIELKYAVVTKNPSFPLTVVNDSGIGTATWSNPGNATSSNDTYATASLTNPSSPSKYLKATNFGFCIPQSATITGILVEWEVSGILGVRDNAARIVKGGVIGSSDRSNTTIWPQSDAFLSHGSSSDLWGLAWTPGDINDAGFGAALSAAKASIFSPTARVDSVRITVTYLP